MRGNQAGGLKSLTAEDAEIGLSVNKRDAPVAPINQTAIDPGYLDRMGGQTFTKFLLTIVVITTIIRSMSRRLKAEIKQHKPFSSQEEEAFLNLLRTADALVRGLEVTLKQVGLSHTQYNILRILRGAAPEGLACRGIGERMLTRDPDMTRLLDRLEARGLVHRARQHKDRRIITTRITEKGMGVLKILDEPIARLHQEQLGHLGEKRLLALVKLLETSRMRVT